MTNTLKLKAVIIKVGYTQKYIANMLHMTAATFNYKLNNKSEFKASEIKIMSKILRLTSKEINEFFLE